MICQNELLNRMEPLMKLNGRPFKKYKNVFAKKATAGEVVHTITKDGLETTNQAKEGDYIVKNQTDAQEMYLISKDKLIVRYDYLQEAEDGFAEYFPTGKVIALELTKVFLVELNLPSEFYFEAPWGEPMVAKENDFLVSPPDQNEIYRIARKEFFETYKLIQ